MFTLGLRRMIVARFTVVVALSARASGRTMSSPLVNPIVVAVVAYLGRDGGRGPIDLNIVLLFEMLLQLRMVSDACRCGGGRAVWGRPLLMIKREDGLLWWRGGEYGAIVVIAVAREVRDRRGRDSAVRAKGGHTTSLSSIALCFEILTLR